MEKPKKDSVVLRKSYAFALRTVKAFQFLTIKQREFVLSKQFLKSGTSIGANVREATFSQSRKEFAAKLNIALKEAHESDYWISLIRDGGYFTSTEAASMLKDADELIRLLTSIIKTTRRNSTL